MIRDILKKIPAAVMLVCDVLLTLVLYDLFYVFIPEIKWFGALYAPALLMLLILSAYIYSLRTGRKNLFRIVSLLMLFICNVFSFEGVGAQVVLVFAFALDLAADNIQINHPVNLTVVAICFVICGLGAAVIAPVITRIEKPKLMTTLENRWFAIFEIPTTPETVEGNAGNLNSTPEDVNFGRLSGNVITNDPFDSEDYTPAMTVTASYPLDKMMIFACYNYDPEKTRFELAESISEGTAPEDRYFEKAFSRNASREGLPYWIDVQANGIYAPMMFYPFCDFRSDAGADFCKDSYIMTYADQPAPFYKYYVDPDAYYRTAASGYGGYVVENYTALPEGFKEKLSGFLNDNNIVISADDRYEGIKQLHELLEDEYTYTNEPPELPEGEDPVLWFLFESKEGYSKHFAAAEVLLLRAAGVPARYAYGYNVEMEAGQSVNIFERDAYAYCQVFLDGSWQMMTELRKPEKSEDSDPFHNPGLIPIDIPVDLSEEEEPEITGEIKTFNWRAIIIPAAVIAALVLLALLFKWLENMFRPTPLQRINYSYKALNKYYFIRTEIQQRMLKVRYSKAGPEEADAVLLEREVAVAQTRLKVQKKYHKQVLLLMYVKCQKVWAVMQNIARAR